MKQVKSFRYPTGPQVEASEFQTKSLFNVPLKDEQVFLANVMNLNDMHLGREREIDGSFHI